MHFPAPPSQWIPPNIIILHKATSIQVLGTGVICETWALEVAVIPNDTTAQVVKGPTYGNSFGWAKAPPRTHTPETRNSIPLTNIDMAGSVCQTSPAKSSDK